MLNEADKALLEALRERLSVRVNVRSRYTTSEKPFNVVEVALLFTDAEGEKHEIDSDYADLPGSEG